MVWLLRLVLLLIVIRLVGRLVLGILQGLSEPRAVRPRQVGLVRDPVCGTYVVPSRALAVRSGQSVQYFCSEECRQKYSLSRR